MSAQEHLQATSEYIPDTTMHSLNGSFVVHIGPMSDWLKRHVPWLAPDEADAFADSLKRAAAVARTWRSSDEDDEQEATE